MIAIKSSLNNYPPTSLLNSILFQVTFQIFSVNFALNLPFLPICFDCLDRVLISFDWNCQTHQSKTDFFHSCSEYFLESTRNCIPTGWATRLWQYRAHDIIACNPSSHVSDKRVSAIIDWTWWTLIDIFGVLHTG